MLTNANEIGHVVEIQSVDFFSIVAQLLTGFRIRLESEAEKPVEQIEVNAAAFLSDLAEQLGMSEGQHDAILGVNALVYLADLMDTRVNVRAAGMVAMFDQAVVPDPDDAALSFGLT